MNAKSVILLSLSVLAGCKSVSPLPQAINTEVSVLGPLIGYWLDSRDPDFVVEIDDFQRVDFAGGQIRRTGRLLASDGDQFTFCVYGQEVTERMTLKDHVLYIDDPGSGVARSLRRLPGPPPGLQHQPVPIPPPRPLPPELVEAIQREIRYRFRDDMRAEMEVHGTELGTSAAPPPEDPIARMRLLDTTSQNRAYIRSIVQEVGWIDATRFGYATSNSAALMIQHSGDRLLMEAALPWIKRDVDTGLMIGDAYALVYDRLQLMLGARQRYGSQISRDREDVPIVYPTEESDEVDTLRKQLGMLPLSDYIKLFGGTETRFSSACSRRASATVGR